MGLRDLFKKQKNANGKYKRLYYSLIAVHAGKVLDIAQEGNYKGLAIMWEGHAADQQCFTLMQEGPIYYIKCKLGDLYLTVDGPQNGARFSLQPKQQGNEKQQFKIDEKEGSKDHTIYTCYNKVIDVEAASKQNGSLIIQWDYTGDKNQLWNFCDPKDITSSSSDLD